MKPQMNSSIIPASNANQSQTFLTIGTVTLAGAMMLIAFPAQAYVGPGAGLSLLSALWAVLAAIVVAVGFVLMWPLRKMMRKRKANRAAKPATANASEHQNS
jgi:membrane protein implicated in regulation of membrane protease activity